MQTFLPFPSTPYILLPFNTILPYSPSTPPPHQHHLSPSPPQHHRPRYYSCVACNPTFPSLSLPPIRLRSNALSRGEVLISITHVTSDVLLRCCDLPCDYFCHSVNTIKLCEHCCVCVSFTLFVIIIRFTPLYIILFPSSP